MGVKTAEQTQKNLDDQIENFPLWENYGNWLLRRLGFKKRGYSSLMKQLHLIQFRWEHPMDENRAEDGKSYRYYFWNDLNGNWLSKDKELLDQQPCSVLEMLVALAIRVEFEYLGDVNFRRPDLFFFTLCVNLGLENCKNKGYDAENVNSIITFHQNSHWNSHPDRGLFPVENPKNDEIWVQMNQYLTEKYVF